MNLAKLKEYIVLKPSYYYKGQKSVEMLIYFPRSI